MGNYGLINFGIRGVNSVGVGVYDIFRWLTVAVFKRFAVLAEEHNHDYVVGDICDGKQYEFAEKR